MKTRILIILFFTLFLGCTNNPYNGYDPPFEYENGDPMPVLLSLGSPNYSITTRGSGAVEGGNNDAVWGKASLYIFSFLKGNNTDFRKTMQSPTTGDKIEVPDCIIDGSLDNPIPNLGKEGKVQLATKTLEWTGIKDIIYYPSTKDPYDFYGYYIDDINVITNITRTQNTISFNLEIDGSQDIMSAVAELTSEQEATIKEEERPTILNTLYSSYTARRNIHPVMRFKHHLVRLKFEIYPGKPEANNVYVKAIEVASKTKAKFTVVDKNHNNIGLDFSIDNTIKGLSLKNSGGQPLSGNYNVEYKSSEASRDIFDRTPTKVGESLLVAPASNYDFTITLEQDFDGERVAFLTPDNLKLSNGALFEAGKEYTVRIAIYGIEEVSITVVPEGWQDGGNIDIDPEKS